MEDKKEQFGRIYDQYIDKIYRFVYLKVNSHEIAQDLCSKVFSRGWEAFRGSIEGVKNPGAFLYQSARNAVTDHYRERGRTKTISSDILPETADFKPNIHEKAVLGQDIEAMKSAIQKLEKEHQDIIIWHYLDDMPIGEIAQLLGRPEGTVRVMLHRGLKELKQIIEEV